MAIREKTLAGKRLPLGYFYVMRDGTLELLLKREVVATFPLAGLNPGAVHEKALEHQGEQGDTP